MRDAFGGVFTMNLFLVFIFIFVAFTAVSLNYAKAFRVKNNVIDFIEENEFTSLEAIKSKSESLKTLLHESDYFKNCDGQEYKEIKDPSGNLEEYCYGGISITVNSIEPVTSEKSIIKYTVTSRADWNLGALNKILVLGGKSENSESKIIGSWSIKGEAKVVAKTN